jgi:putative iron-regulated protein
MNQERRREYIDAVSGLLVEDLTSVRDAWAPDTAGNYRADFVALEPREGLRRILFGMGSLSGGELSGERMNVALTTRDRNDEHSCFSDTTLQDHLNDAIGIQNVYLGRYTRTDGTTVSGASLSDLVRARDADLDTRFRSELQASIDAIEAIPAPFDQAILGDDTAPGRVAVLAAVNALRDQTATIVEIADLFDITLNLE